MKRLTWLGIVSSAILVACASVPEKPRVALYTVRAPDALIGARTDTGETVPQVPIASADHFVCFSPNDWGQIIVYMKVLRMRAERSCK